MSRGRFVGRTAIVTGSASGIGRQTAVQFAAEGAQVVVADIDAEGAGTTVAQIEEAGGVARVSITDVGDPSAVEELVERTVADWGRIDILHNNAYWAPLYTSVPDTTIEQWDRTIAVTLTGVFLGCKYAIPHMIEAGGGVIVNTASTAAIVASPTFGAYSAAKSGVLGLTRSIAYDFGPKNIRCNAVLPGLIRTAATAPVLSNEERSEWLRSKIVVGRIGEPSDIAHAVLYLASEESSFMTGQTLVIDGGRQIGVTVPIVRKERFSTSMIELLGIPMGTSSSVDIYSGVARLAGKVWGSLHRAENESTTVCVVVHPSSNFLGHYLLAPLAERGVDAVGLTTRYIGNDSSLLMENCVLDIGAAIRFLRDRGYERVVLIGNSGGGGLSALYQSQAESPTITQTPAGDPPDLTTADLPPADALLELMAHPGRALVYTDWLDPAIVDENDRTKRDPSLDLFSGTNVPPFTQDFLDRYRAAQYARNRRITAWVHDQLAQLDAAGGDLRDLPFLVHGTVADPRFVDMTIEPSDRAPGTLWGPTETANSMPASLGHYTSLRSWLSQWSVDESNCDGPLHLARTHVPTLVMYGTADQVCFPSYAMTMYDAITHDQKSLIPVDGGTHYLQGQPELQAWLADTVVDWMKERDLVV